MAFRVLILDRFDSHALALLKSHPALDVTWNPEPTPAPESLALCDGLIIRSRTRIDSGLLAQAPYLKAIATATSGFDHIDLEAVAERGITTMYTPEANAASACELTWGLIIACSRKLIDAQKAVKSGQWKREALLGRQLSEKTLGIVGLGRIGERVARVGLAFGMKIVVFDPYKDDVDFSRSSAQRVSFEELLKLADIVTFHVPGTEETRHMLSRERLESMNRNAIVINASRGPVVTERDLIEALAEKWIAGCGLDVFEREPLPRDSRLLDYPGVVLSPHIGATTAEAFATASREAAQKIITFATTGASTDRLPPEEAWYQARFAVRKRK